MQRIVPVLLVAACASAPPTGVLERVEPDEWVEGTAREVAIFGRDLHVGVAADLTDPSGVRVRQQFDASIGGLALENVRWQSSEVLVADVPGLLAPGVHSLSVTTPLGEELTLADAVLIIDDPDVNIGGWEHTESTQRIPMSVAWEDLNDPIADFPVMIRLDPQRVDYAEAAAGGADVRFFSGGVALEYEIDDWVPGGESILWIALPQVRPGETTQFAMYYGSGTQLPYEPWKVWENGYVGVWHFDDLAQQQRDSTVFENHASVVGDPASADGPLAHAISFNSDFQHDDSLLVPWNASLANLDQFTLQAFIVPRSIDEFQQRVVQMRGVDTSSSNYGLHFGARVDTPSGIDVESRIEVRTGGRTWESSSDSIDLDTWTYIGATFEYAERDGFLWVNDDDDSFNTGQGADWTIQPPLDIGGVEGRDGRGFRGLIDEVRISNTARSADWMEMDYLSVTGQLVAYGATELRP